LWRGARAGRTCLQRSLGTLDNAGRRSFIIGDSAGCRSRRATDRRYPLMKACIVWFCISRLYLAGQPTE
jgi:hypothetical protein